MSAAAGSSSVSLWALCRRRRHCCMRWWCASGCRARLAGIRAKGGAHRRRQTRPLCSWRRDCFCFRELHDGGLGRFRLDCGGCAGGALIAPPRVAHRWWQHIRAANRPRPRWGQGCSCTEARQATLCWWGWHGRWCVVTAASERPAQPGRNKHAAAAMQRGTQRRTTTDRAQTCRHWGSRSWRCRHAGSKTLRGAARGRAALLGLQVAGGDACAHVRQEYAHIRRLILRPCFTKCACLP